MIIDFHIHYTPPALATGLPELAEREPYWAALLAPGPSGATLQGWADAERMLADMDRAGVGRVVVQGEYYQRHESCVARNEQGLELARRFPARVAAFAVVQPRAGGLALEEIERCAAGGMAGVGELNPYAQGFALDEPDFLRLAESCVRHDLPLLLHANEPVGRHYPGKATTPLAAYYGLAARYPELRLVLAHWGGGLLFYELIPSVRRALRNVWYDTAASPLTYPTPAIFPAALACVDHRKILFASDYPLRVVPPEQHEPDFRPFLRQIEALALPDEVRADVMGGNAERLLERAADHRPQTAAHQTAIAAGALPVGEHTSVALLAAAHPGARQVLDRYGIPWQDAAVPFWEPLGQALAARGYGDAAAAHILAELREAATADRGGSGGGDASP